MDIMALHFLRPWWLLALIPLAAAVVWLARLRPGVRRWADVVDAHLAPYVLIAGATARSRLASGVVGLAGTLALFALAGPVWQKLPQPVFASEDPLVIVLDLSQSMSTQDITPSRLERARFKVADILERRDEGQTALIVYAADAYVVSPLTDDTATITSQLSALTPELMPSQGSRADRALAKAGALLEQAGLSHGDVLLVTDGVDADRAGAAAGDLAAAGIRVSVLGVGTPAGGPVPGRDGFLRHPDGAIVVASLDRDALRNLAGRGGGVYQDLAPDDRDIERLSAVLDGSHPADVSQRDLTADVWREEGPWLLLPLLPLAALAFRRGILVVVVAVLILPPPAAEAAGTDSLWLRPDQRAARALADGDAAGAAALFADRAWKGVASHRAGDYEAALQALAGLDSIDATYNRGNTLARMGRFDEAIAAYDSVLERDPQHADALFNRDLLRQLQEQNDTQQPQDDSANDGEPGDSPGSDSGGQPEPGDGQQQESQAAGSEQPGQQEPAAADGGDRMDPPGAETGDEESAAELTQPDEPPAEEQSAAMQMSASDEPPSETEQAVEQWLRRIPDDPGGLLRRKFLYQYRQQEQPRAEREQW